MWRGACSQPPLIKTDAADKPSQVDWTPEENKTLKILIKNLGQDWKAIAGFFPGRTDVQCMQHWKNHLTPDVGNNNWTKEEDEKIKELVAKYGTKQWPLISQHLNGRHWKHCCERWQTHLDPNIGCGFWSNEEDLVVVKAQSVLGNRWSDISRLLPGRTEASVKDRWYCNLKDKADMASFKKEADVISLDFHQYVKEEVDFHCDVVLDTEPVKHELKRRDLENARKIEPKTVLVPPPSVPIKNESSQTPTSPLSPHPSSTPSPGISSSAAPAVNTEQKKFQDAALRMIAEEMLPLSFVEGRGFRSFVNTINPEYDRLTQRAMGLQLHHDVERTFKPQLIRDLKATNKGGEKNIHVTFDLWSGDETKPAEEPIILVQLHFITETWEIRRPVVAFRHLNCKDLCSAVASELEGVILSYGVFPHSIGYVLTNRAKEALAANKLFGDYKIMCSPTAGEADGEEMVAFLSDLMPETASPFSQLEFGTKTTCVARRLQRVIMEALKNSRVIENLLSQVHNVIGFFRSSVYWSEVLLTEFYVSLCPPSTNCRWNTVMLSLRTMVQEAAWSAVMTVLARARVEATDIASVPPLIMAKREQVVDILTLLQPFEEALQVLQGSGVMVCLIIPSLIGLDKTLESCVTNYTHFRQALRTGLHTHFQSLIFQKDIILATLLDPRIKLKPFSDTKHNEQTVFLNPPTKGEVHDIIDAALESMTDPDGAKLSQTEHQPEIEQNDESTTDDLAEASDPSMDENSEDEGGGNALKRKSIFNFLQPPTKVRKMSEFDVYLQEPLLEKGVTLLYWKSATRFPLLQNIAKKLLAIPATAGGFDRLFPMAACILKARRNRLSPHTMERLLLYKNAFRTKSVKKRRTVGKTESVKKSQ